MRLQLTMAGESQAMNLTSGVAGSISVGVGLSSVYPDLS